MKTPHTYTIPVPKHLVRDYNVFNNTSSNKLMSGICSSLETELSETLNNISVKSIPNSSNITITVCPDTLEQLLNTAVDNLEEMNSLTPILTDANSSMSSLINFYLNYICYDSDDLLCSMIYLTAE